MYHIIWNDGFCSLDFFPVRALTETISDTLILPGIFAAGDCRAKGVRQLATAAADGAAAALAACAYMDEIRLTEGAGTHR